MKRFSLKFILLSGLFLTQFAGAQMTSSSPLINSGMTSEEVALRDKARRKMYPGGLDEEPLKIQAQLPALKSKFVSEEEDVPPPTDDVD